MIQSLTALYGLAMPGALCRSAAAAEPESRCQAPLQTNCSRVTFYKLPRWFYTH